jgi:glycyl-tRNA synthetase beta chain
MEGLGTLYDKTRRVENLVAWLCEQLPQMSAEDVATAQRAALLSKCDQVTLMVGDGKLAALQGYIGGHYARLAGEPEVVAQALADEYLPVRQHDPLPGTLPSRLLAVADRLDNLAAAFTLGMIPKGTRDPQGLRRQTQGLISILVDSGLRLPLAGALGCALAQMPTPDPAPKGALGAAEAEAALVEFFATRVEAMLQEEGLSYDVVRAALGAPWTDVVEAMARGRALAGLRASVTDFEGFVDTATRPANICRSADLAADVVVEPALFEHDTEKALWALYQTVRTRVHGLKQQSPVDYAGIWAALRELQAPIAAMFDAVMINAEDPALRRNRLAMMRELDALYLHLADFRQIVQ